MGEGTGKKDRTKKVDNGQKFESPGDQRVQIRHMCLNRRMYVYGHMYRE